MEKLKPYLGKAVEKGATHALVLKTAAVFTAPWVRIKCRFGCPGYGKRLCCPPYSPTPEETRAVLDSYDLGLLIHRHVKKGWGPVTDLNQLAVDLERQLFLDGYYKAWALGSGPCDRCEECDVAGTCRNPDVARPSMEACGIDVFKTARGQGLPIGVVRNRQDERDFYTLVLVE